MAPVDRIIGKVDTLRHRVHKIEQLELIQMSKNIECLRLALVIGIPTGNLPNLDRVCAGGGAKFRCSHEKVACCRVKKCTMTASSCH